MEEGKGKEKLKARNVIKESQIIKLAQDILWGVLAACIRH